MAAPGDRLAVASERIEDDQRSNLSDSVYRTLSISLLSPQLAALLIVEDFPERVRLGTVPGC